MRSQPVTAQVLNKCVWIGKACIDLLVAIELLRRSR